MPGKLGPGAGPPAVTGAGLRPLPHRRSQSRSRRARAPGDILTAAGSRRLSPAINTGGLGRGRSVRSAATGTLLAFVVGAAFG